MFKKIIMMILCGVLVCNFWGCKQEDDTKQDNNEIVQDDNKMEEELEQKEDKNESIAKDIELPVTYKVPGKAICVDVPDYQEMEKGYTRLFIVHDQKYVAITADIDGDISDLSTAHEQAFEKFRMNIQNYSYVNSLNVIEDTEENINGIDVYKYEGTLNCGHDTVYDAYVIGYSFIMDGVPCTITGSVIDEAQDQAMIDEMKETVEAVIQTLRSER